MAPGRINVLISTRLRASCPAPSPSCPLLRWEERVNTKGDQRADGGNLDFSRQKANALPPPQLALPPRPLAPSSSRLPPRSSPPRQDSQAHGSILVAEGGHGLRTPNPCQGPKGCARQAGSYWKQKAETSHASPWAEENQAVPPCSLIAMGKTQNSQRKGLWLTSAPHPPTH